MGFSDLWKKITQTPSFQPTRIFIPDDHTDKADQLKNNIITAEKDYFTVRVNEMYLSYSSKWFSTFDPVVFVVSEFIYGGQRRVVPFVVGPAMLKGKMENLPEGMIFSNTTVAGTHPYKGDSLALTIVLSQVKQTDHLQKFIEMIESTAATYMMDFATMVNDYVKVAKVVMKGMENLMGMEETTPIVGFRKEINPNAGDDFKPGYSVLINKDQSTLQESMFWVKNDRLFYGNSLETAVPYREGDYVLYSIMKTTARNDTSTLFSAVWDDVKNYAIKEAFISDDKWQIIKSRMFGLQCVLTSSPDLTQPQADILWNDYVAEIKKIRASKDQLGSAVMNVSLDDFDKKALDTLNNL